MSDSIGFSVGFGHCFCQCVILSMGFVDELYGGFLLGKVKRAQCENKEKFRSLLQ